MCNFRMLRRPLGLLLVLVLVLGSFSTAEFFDINASGAELFVATGGNQPATGGNGPATGGNGPDPGEDGVTVTTTVTLNGNPASNIRVYLFEKDEDGAAGSIDSEYSDINGKVVFNNIGPPQAGSVYYFWVRKDAGYVEYDGWAKGKTFDLTGAIPAIELDAGVSVTATVTVNGVPTAGIEVLLFDDGSLFPIDAAISGSDGKVTFHNLAAGVEHHYSVERTDSYVGYNDRGTLQSTVFKPDINPPATIALISGYSVSTRVTYQGNPVTGLEVSLRQGISVSGSLYSTATTDANGVAVFYSLGRANSYYFTVTANQGEEYADYNGKMLGKTFNVLANGPAGVIPSVELEPANAITVNVSLETGGELARVDLALVYADANGREVYSRTVSRYNLDSNLSLTFNNLPAWERCYFEIERQVGRYAPYNGLLLGEIFAVPGPEQNIVLSVGHDVTTTVTLNGVPKQGARVQLEGESIPFISGENADTDGKVTFRNVPDSQNSYFRVNRKEGEYAFYNGAIKNKIFTIPDSAYPAVELEVGQPASVYVTYRGQPVAAEIELLKDDSFGHVNSAWDGMSGSNGRALMTNIPNDGNYYFYIWVDDAQYNYADYDGRDYNEYFTFPGPEPHIELDPNWNQGAGNSNNDNDDDDDDDSYSGSAAFGGAYSSTPTAAETWMSASNIKSAGKSYGKYGVRAAAWARLTGKYYHDTMLGAAVGVRLYIDEPGLFTKDAYVSGYVSGPETERIRGIFERWYKNQIRVIHFDQPGKWERPVGVAAKLDLAGMDTANLYFYYYDPVTNSYIRIENPEYRIDANGYLHFKTEYAGEIIISDGVLEKL